MDYSIIGQYFHKKQKELKDISDSKDIRKMEKIDLELIEEYKKLLSEFYMISAKLSLLKKLCAESNRLMRSVTKGRK